MRLPPLTMKKKILSKGKIVHDERMSTVISRIHMYNLRIQKLSESNEELHITAREFR